MVNSVGWRISPRACAKFYARIVWVEGYAGTWQVSHYDRQRHGWQRKVKQTQTKGNSGVPSLVRQCTVAVKDLPHCLLHWAVTCTSWVSKEQSNVVIWNLSCMYCSDLTQVQRKFWRDVTQFKQAFSSQLIYSNSVTTWRLHWQPCCTCWYLAICVCIHLWGVCCVFCSVPGWGFLYHPSTSCNTTEC